jgi:hypothetical protein
MSSGAFIAPGAAELEAISGFQFVSCSKGRCQYATVRPIRTLGPKADRFVSEKNKYCLVRYSALL